MKSHYKAYIVAFFFSLAVILRGYNLHWGNGYFFHPDENNMAHAVSVLSLSHSLSPDFYAYGQFPLYLSYFTAVISHSIHNVLHSLSLKDSYLYPYSVSFSEAVFWLRFYSFLFSVLSLYVFYKITTYIVPLDYALLAVFFASFTPGLIQSAHFGTTESMLTFFTLVTVFIAFIIIKQAIKKKSSNIFIYLLGFIFGFSSAIKLTFAYLFPACLSVLFLSLYIKKQISIKKIIKILFSFSLLSFTGYIISSPYNIISLSSFISSMKYEISVANGLDVFYTRQFINTTPLIFHIEKIFPYFFSWPLFVFMLFTIFLGLILILFSIFISKTANNSSLLFIGIVFIFILSYTIPVSRLYVKWTRFITPITPLFILVSTYSLYYILKYSKKITGARIAIFIIVGITLFLTSMKTYYFFQIYYHPDVRVEASKFIENTIPSQSTILTESGNVVDVPIHYQKNYHIISFDFYTLDHPSEGKNQYKKLTSFLEEADYIIIPSRRVFANIMRFHKRYPLTNAYYHALFNNTLGFEYQYICTFSSCRKPDKIIIRPSDYASDDEFLNHFLIDDEKAEETWSVFDHPVIRIYKKTSFLSSKEYDTILTNTSLRL